MAEVKRLHTPEGTPPTHCMLAAPQHASNVMQAVRELYRVGDLCDYTIIAEGQSFPTHRAMLASVSDYFRAMLTGPMIEARQDHVNLKGVTAGAIQSLLEFTYTGQLALNMDDIMEVLAGACHLQMKSAIELCSRFLLGEITTKSCVDILNISEMFALCSVKDAAMKFVTETFEKVAETEQLSKLNCDHLCALLRSNRLRISSELTLFGHVLQWIDSDLIARSREAPNLFQYVRFSLMKPEELVDQVSRTQFMQSDVHCRVFLDEALHYHLLPSRQPLLQTPRTQVRNEPRLVAFGGRYGLNVGYKHNCNKMYVLNDGRWLQLPSSESNFLYSAVAVVDNFMYVCGGMGKPAHARATCQRFDPRKGTWTRLAHMNRRRQSFPLIPHCGKLYAFGGGCPGYRNSFEHPPTALCEVYSIDQNEWMPIASLPAKLKSCSACVHEGKIYLSGGRTDAETVLSMYLYDVDEDAWTEKSPMLLPHAGHAMLSVGGRIYVIDRTNLCIEAYMPTTDDWVKIAAPSFTLSGVARPAVLGPWVYFVSYVEAGEDYQCKRYNVLTLQLEQLGKFPEQVHCVIGAPLVLPQSAFSDPNNNP